MTDVIVIGAGPAGVLAALRAADLGARTMLVTRADFGGMAANDGPVPVRTLAHAARLMREARQLSQYGIQVSEPVLHYPLLLGRVREVVNEFFPARTDRFFGRNRPRARWLCTLCRPAHHRHRERVKASS